MTKGIGVDIVEIRRLQEMIRKYGDHFLKKVFTAAEIEYCEKMARPEIHYSGRWAAKEAFYKALPPACQKLSGWKSIEVMPGASRAPSISICSRALQTAMEREGIRTCLVSISHEKTVCVSMVAMDGPG